MTSKCSFILLVLSLIFFCFTIYAEEASETKNNNLKENIISDSGFSMDSQQYLCISGYAKYPKDKDFIIADLFILDYSLFDFPVGKGPYIIKLLDRKDRIVAKYNFNTSTMRVSTDKGDRVQDSGMFAFSIPVSSEVNKVVIKKGKIVLTERMRSLNSPKVEFVRPRNNSKISGTVEIEWIGTDPDGDDLVYRLESSDDCGKNWSPETGFISAKTIEKKMKYLCGNDASFIAMSGGDLENDCGNKDVLLRILCSDGFDASRDEMKFIVSNDE